MQIFQGKCPFSAFRLEKRRSTLRQAQPAVRQVVISTLYLLQAEELSQEEMLRLINIIDKTAKPWQAPKNPYVIIAPRFSTESPWSSKATDILHVCGLAAVSRIEKALVYELITASSQEVQWSAILPLIHDRMTETCVLSTEALAKFFTQHDAKPSQFVPFRQNGRNALVTANKTLGLALSEKEIDYLFKQYQVLNRDPSDAELMMFAQINSEHCRHKIFNAKWTIAGKDQEKSLFDWIKNTYASQSRHVLSAYQDNGAIIEGSIADQLMVDPINHAYSFQEELAHIVIKVETHNHPTAISPFEGAATGAGGEIRDEGATGIGGRPKAGLVGFSVSNLHIPGHPKPWEQYIGYPSHVASALEIMLQGPIGAASFNNEFGRPNLCGYFRTFEMLASQNEKNIKIRGYHKPIMIAGGLGQIRPMAVKKYPIPSGARLIVLGGPAMLIGLGGGAASSIYSGASKEELDYASVQRSNPEMQRRCQEVITHCLSLGKNNPIISIHDVGAGGLSNALSELVHDAKKGASIDLHAIPTADASLNAMEIWCNEAQERYVLAIDEQHLPLFEKIAARERCPYAVVGVATNEDYIAVYDSRIKESPVDMPLNLLFGEGSKLHCEIDEFKTLAGKDLEITEALGELIARVLQHPTVADKHFLITIGDRSVTGLVARDQMIGPWQVPVSDVAVTANGYSSYRGEAMAMGERPPLALIDARASAAMAVGEAITNIVAADIAMLEDIKLSANWMAAFGEEEEVENLYQAVREIGERLCPALGICIPVGKDSLSMQMKWQQDQTHVDVAAPLSLVISAFAPVKDIRKTLTPLFEKNFETELLLIDLGFHKNRLGASCLAEVLNQLGREVPNLDSPELLINFFNAMTELRQKNLILAYHDRSDGGLLATVCEMMFASHLGVTLNLDCGEAIIPLLFNEELGAVIQYRLQDKDRITRCLERYHLKEASVVIGCLNKEDALVIQKGEECLYRSSRISLNRCWSKTSYHLQALRDNPDCALQEYDKLLDDKDPGLNANLTFTFYDSPPVILSTKPQVAILREQGVNGHQEMAAAFLRAGFSPIDVHMTDILSGQTDLKNFQGLVACGGFSYGDVLGAGRGWANSILYNEKARTVFERFFNEPNVFVLGVCNGCQMLSHLKELIPGASHWPQFERNFSEQFEARLSLVKINASPSLFFQGMEEAVLPIVVSHGEGRVAFRDEETAVIAIEEKLIPMQYVDHYHHVTENYPENPNGSPKGIASVTSKDGRFTIMMPHAERVFRNVQFSWKPADWKNENSPWFQLFHNAYKWLS